MQFITNCLPVDPFGHAMRLIVRQTWPKKKSTKNKWNHFEFRPIPMSMATRFSSIRDGLVPLSERFLLIAQTDWLSISGCPDRGGMPRKIRQLTHAFKSEIHPKWICIFFVWQAQSHSKCKRQQQKQQQQKLFLNASF